MNTENILVPFHRHSSDLESLYHSFALAERIRAKIFVLFLKESKGSHNNITPIEIACQRVVQDACEEGIPVSFHLADDRFETELVNFCRAEHIDLIVLGERDELMEEVLRRMKSKISAQVIKVERKQNINPMQKR